jgi:hypothetical protein
MSLIGTAIGALVALLPRPKRAFDRIERNLDKLGALGEQLDSEIARLTEENKQLRRSHARLVDHIETLEREILLEQHICAHWKEEAERLARQSREAREAREQQARLALQAHLQALALEQQAPMAQRQNPLPTPSWAEMNGRNAMAYAQAQSAQQQNLALAQQHQLAMNQVNQQQAFGFCNCVPSRAQVWGAAREGDR